MDDGWIDGDACADLVVASESIGLALLDVAARRIRRATESFTALTGLSPGDSLLSSVAAAHRGAVSDLVTAAVPAAWRSVVVTFRDERVGPTPDRKVSVRSGDDGVVVAVEHTEGVDRRVHERLLAVNEELAEAHRQLRSSQLVIRKLEGLLPVCAWCHRVRSDDDRTWLGLEEYLVRHEAVTLTHSICPRCSQKLLEGEG